MNLEMGRCGGGDFAVSINRSRTRGRDGEGSSLLRMDERKNVMTASVKIREQPE